MSGVLTDSLWCLARRAPVFSSYWGKSSVVGCWAAGSACLANFWRALSSLIEWEKRQRCAFWGALLKVYCRRWGGWREQGG